MEENFKKEEIQHYQQNAINRKSTNDNSIETDKNTDTEYQQNQ